MANFLEKLSLWDEKNYSLNFFNYRLFIRKYYNLSLIEIKLFRVYKILSLLFLILKKMSSNTIDVPVMYAYSSHTNIPWNISQYQPTREYLDPEKIKIQGQKKEINYARPSVKFEMDERKKKFYLDETIKSIKDNPSPSKYKTLSLFDQSQNRKKARSIHRNPKLSKYTYLDWIQIQQKSRKTPSVGKYNLMKTDKQLKKQLYFLTKAARKIKKDQNRHFYDGPQTTTLQVPAAGSYNPHIQIQDIPKPSRKDHHFWVDKHKKLLMSQRTKKGKQPAPTSYRPVSASFNSFDKIEIDFKKFQKKNIKDKKLNPHLGFTISDAKFQYTRENKVKIKQKRPHSSTYNTIIPWKGKNQDSKKNNWVRCISAGPTRSVYH